MKKWEFKTGGWIADTPVVNDEFVFTISKDGYVYFLHKDTGDMKKRHFIGDVTRGECFLTGEILFIVNEHRDKRKLYCFDAKRHNLLWEKVIPFKSMTRGHIKNGTYYCLDERGIIESFSIYNGKAGARIKPGGKLSDRILFDDEYLFAEKNDGEIIAVNLDNGEIAWNIRPPSKNLTLPVIYENKLCVYCPDSSYIFFRVLLNASRTFLFFNSLINC